MKHRILIADDEESARSGLAALLVTWGYEVQEAVDGKDALERSADFHPSVVIADLIMPGMDGLSLLKPLGELEPAAAVILLTGHATVESAVSAMKDGAYDYLTKPVEPSRLRVLLEKAVERVEVLREVTLLRRQLRQSRGFGPLLGASPAMQEVYRFIELAAASSAPVLITGETGTGKELVARTIHQMSGRTKGPFVAVNCSAIPETLLESELFGHERGAFTGALERRAGYFELAAAGTIFLDEITEMSPALQAKYLRVLQDGVIRRLGAKNEVTVDVRIVAATNRDAGQAVQDKALREDLYYRINVLNVSLPPLRRRPEDIPLLVEVFTSEFNEKYEREVKSVDDAAMARLCEHGWPGNVRELRNVIERAVVGCAGDLITPEYLPFSSSPPPEPGQDGVIVLPVGTTLEQGERELIRKTLASVNNNKTRAAAILGTTPKTLHNKARRWSGRLARESAQEGRKVGDVGTEHGVARAMHFQEPEEVVP
jgi:DNA-binding NtrC family response regulator